MFDFAWTEIALIGVVAMVLIGPKDLPVAMRAVADMVKKARRMAGEFQTHVDEMMRDADLKDVRDTISEIRGMDIKGNLRRQIDADGSIHAALTGDPFAPQALAANNALAAPVHPDGGTLSMTPAAPSFIPPGTEPDHAPPAHAPPERAAPAFIPPEAAHTPDPAS